MKHTEIKISGPGGTMNYEVEIVVKALREAGCEVEVENRYPAEEGHVEAIRERIDAGTVSKKVKVIAQHIPWGG